MLTRTIKKAGLHWGWTTDFCEGAGAERNIATLAA